MSKKDVKATRKAAVKKKETKNDVERKAPDSLYRITALCLILLLWQVSIYIINPASFDLPTAAVLFISFVVCVRKLLQEGIKIEKVSSWKNVYYSLPTYVLLALTISSLAALLRNPIAEMFRAATGLPAVNIQGMQTIGISLISTGLFYINAVYAFVLLIVSATHSSVTFKHKLFNVGIFIILASSLIVTGLYVHLVVNAPADGYPDWQF